MTEITVIVLAFAQNIAFTMTSRSRNRSSMGYHAICSVFSNAVWFLTMRELVVAELNRNKHELLEFLE